MKFRVFCLALLCSFGLVANAKVVDSGSFQQEISSGTTLVDFYAKWCGPCQKLGPVIDEVAKDMQGKANIVKVNVDQSKDLAQKYNIQGVPTMILFKDGKEVGRLSGFNSKENIVRFIESRSR